MKCLNRNGVPADLAVLICRIMLGTTFIMAGVNKLTPKEGRTLGEELAKFSEYVASQAPLPESIGAAYGYALPFVELAAGALLVIGLLTRVTSGVISLMLISFAIGMTMGVINPNTVMASLALLLVFTGSGRFGVDSFFSKCKSSSCTPSVNP
jgi:putative oxidoreductase